MRVWQRMAVALGVAGLVSAVLRLRSRGTTPVTPPSSGGWRPLEGPDLQ